MAAVLSVAWHRRPVALVDPPDCSGTLDLILALMLRGLDGVSVGTLLAWTNGLIAFAALSAFSCLVRALTGSLLITVACGCALIATAAFERALGPANALAVLTAVSVAALAAHRLASDLNAARSGRAQIIAASAAICLLAPSLILPAALVIVWTLALERPLTGRRVAIAIAVAASAAGAASVAVYLSSSGLSASRPAFACVWQSGFDGGGIRERIAQAAADIGPFPFALAALGLFAYFSGSTKTQRNWAIAALSVSLLAAWHATDAAGTVPTVMGFWCQVAIGLRELMAEGAARTARRVAAVIVLALLPILQVERLRQQNPSPAPSVYGHGVLSQEALWRTLRALPDVTIVAENASTHLLLRASMSQLERSGKHLRMIPRDARAIAGALKEGRVFAFPRAQAELRNRGVQFEKSSGQAIGLAEVGAVHPCSPLERRWTDAPAAAVAGGFALVASHPDGRGPVTIYLAGPGPFTATPLGWREREKRGFHVRTYAQAELRELRDALTTQGLDPSSPVLSAAHVVRITMWRTPGAPTVLPVTVTERPRTAIARVEEQTDRPALEICGSF